MRLEVANRQRTVPLDLKQVAAQAGKALPLCLENPGSGDLVLRELEEVAATIVSDRMIARVNRQFLAHEGPTDVITFDHGEILIGAGTAEKNAKHFRKPLEEELILYIIHGLLHLNGWSDKSTEEAARMQEVQESILRQLL